MSQIRSWRPSRATVIASTAALALAMGGTAYAAIPNSTTGVISGCYQTLLGNLRVIDAQAGQHCNVLEKQLDWNQTGPPGPKGSTGPAGPAGPQGPAGEPGSSAGDQVFFAEASGTFGVDTRKLLPAGSYVVRADIYAITTLNSGTNGSCELRGPDGNLIGEQINIPVDGEGRSVSLTRAFNHPGGEIALSCGFVSPGGGTTIDTDATLLATKVASVG